MRLHRSPNRTADQRAFYSLIDAGSRSFPARGVFRQVRLAMITDHIDVTRRRPVWEAISDLWRDTELQDYEIEHIAGVLIASGYSRDELHEIYAREVAPVVWRNLITAVPPVWAGFDTDWLTEEILRGIRSPRGNFLHRCYERSRLAERVRTWAVRDDWARVLRAIESKVRG